MLIFALFFGLLVISMGAYFFQEKLIFFPGKLSSSYQFSFPDQFDEINYNVEEGIKINALHFKADQSKGVVFYSHGNAGSLRNWGLLADTFIPLGYDLLIYDLLI